MATVHEGKRRAFRGLVLRGAVLAVFLSGCAETRIIGETEQHGARGQLTYKQAHDRLHGKWVKVILRDSQEVRGTIIGIAPDSVRVLDDVESTRRAFAIHQVRWLEKTDHLDGGILGLLGGTVGGFLLGAGVGELTIPRGGDMRGLGIAIFSLGGAGLGALGGTIFGAAHGIVTHYEMADTLAAGSP
jgi:hypothetical protein